MSAIDTIGLDPDPRLLEWDGVGFPPPGHPERDRRLALMRAGFQRAKEAGKLGRKKGKAKSKTKPAARPKPAKAVGEAELIDTGRPEPVPMAGGSPLYKVGGADADEAEIRKHLFLGCEMLSRIPGHEHWHREEDEIALVSGPATRIYSRLDAGLRDKIRQMSDPVALVVASVCVFGPSIMMEVRGVRTRPAGRNNRRRQREEQDQRATGDWAGGDVASDTAPVATNGAQPTPYPPGIPTQGI